MFSWAQLLELTMHNAPLVYKRRGKTEAAIGTNHSLVIEQELLAVQQGPDQVLVRFLLIFLLA
jgi:hypothetical protein